MTTYRSCLLSALALALGLIACGESESVPIKVYKYDGSTQCANDGTSAEEMAKELTDAGVEVLCGQKGGDGRAYCAACGCGTGAINVYTIHSHDQGGAETLEFRSVSDLPEHHLDQRCP